MRVSLKCLGYLAYIVFATAATDLRIIQVDTVAIPQLVRQSSPDGCKATISSLGRSRKCSYHRETCLIIRGGWSNRQMRFSAVSGFISPRIPCIPSDATRGVSLSPHPSRALSEQDLKLLGEVDEKHKNKTGSMLSAFVLVQPGRFVKLSICALLLAELVGYSDVLDNPKKVQLKVEKSWNDFRSKLRPSVKKIKDDFRGRIETARHDGGLLNFTTWTSPRRVWTSIEKLPSRYQFAIGAFSGMSFSPLVWSLGRVVLKIGLIAYLVSEANYYILKRGDKEIPVLQNDVWLTADNYLENVRNTTHELANDPRAVFLKLRDGINNTFSDSVKIPPSIRKGFITGTVLGVAIG